MHQFAEDFHEFGVLGLHFFFFFLKELISVVICSHNDLQEMRDAISQAQGKSNCHNQKQILNAAIVPDNNKNEHEGQKQKKLQC